MSQLQLLQKLTEKDLPELLNILNPVASKYSALGLQLNVQFSQICNIEHNHSTCERRLSAVLVERLNQGEPLALNDIVSALKTPCVNKSELARSIETHYLTEYQSSSSSTQHEGVLQSQSHTALTTNTPTVSQVSVNLSQSLQSQQHSFHLQLPTHHNFQSSTPHTIDQILSSNQLLSLPHSNYVGPTSNTQLQSHTTFNYTSPFQQPESCLYSNCPSPHDPMWPLYTLHPSSHQQHYMYTTPPSAPFSTQAQPSQYSSSHHTSLLAPVPTTYPVFEDRPPAERLEEEMRSQSEHQSVPSQYQPQFGYNIPSTNYSLSQSYSFAKAIPTSETNIQSSQVTMQPCYTQLCSSHQQDITPPCAPGSMQAQPSQYSSSHHTFLPTTHSVLEGRPPPTKRLKEDLKMSSQSEHQSVPNPRQYQHQESSTLTPVQQFIEFVKRTYRSSVVESDTSVVKWPPTPSQVYINLACIDRKRVKSNSKNYDELTKNMIEYGDVDVIRATKGPIDFHEIANGIFKEGTGMPFRGLIIVEGAPGVGKSTFAREYCRRWERGEIAGQYQLVLLLRLRDSTISEAKSLNDLIYHPLEGVAQAVCKELVHSHNLHTMIILEGYDELPDHCRKGSSVFNDLISGKMLPSATILVTSRPWATQRIRTKHEGRIYQHIEVLGFTNPQVNEYIHSSKIPEDKVSGLEEYMERYPQIRMGMYIPLNSAIVVTVYLESLTSGLSMPTSLTELYSALVFTLLVRYLRGHDMYDDITSISTFDKLPPPVNAKFCELCKLAYSGIVKNCGKVQLIFKDLAPEFDNLGFMDSVNELYVTRGTVSSHNFLHLTFQEYFAAVHISKLSAEKQMEFFQRNHEGRYKVVLKFLAGLNKLNCFTEDIVNDLFKANAPLKNASKHEICSDLEVDVNFINWMYEAQNDDVIASLLGQKTVGFTIKPRGMSLMDYYSLGHCIAHSQCQWMLTVEVKEISEEKIKMLALGANTEEVTSGKVIGLCGGDEDKLLSLTKNSLNLLFTEWKSILHLHQLYIQLSVAFNKIEWPDLSSLQVLKLINLYTGRSSGTLDLGSLPCLKSLTIHTASECYGINKNIIDSTNLAELSMNLSETEFNYSFEAISKTLASNRLPLERLEIKKVSFTNTAVDNLIEFITNTKTLLYITIIDCTFNAEQLLALACAMNQKPTLQVMMETLKCFIVDGDNDAKCFIQLINDYPDIGNSTILNEKIWNVTEIGAVYLAQAICHNRTSSNFDCSGSSIGDDGAVAIAEALHHNSTIQNLGLEFNKIGDDGAVAIAEALRHNSTIQNLALKFNKIGDDGAVTVAEALHHNSTLQDLNLQNNNIGDDGAVAIAEALHHNSTMNSLSLYNNNISDDGAVAIAKALHHNSTIQNLNLFKNNISDDGAVALAEALHHNSTLQRLNLYGNINIGEKGTHQLVEALTVNKSINILHLPYICEEYATQCQQYNLVKEKICFWYI